MPQTTTKKTNNQKNHSDSLCIDCDEAWCPWIQRGDPTPGWDAEPTIINYCEGADQKKLTSSFRVTACPMFRPLPKATLAQSRDDFNCTNFGRLPKNLYTVYSLQTGRCLARRINAERCADLLHLSRGSVYAYASKPQRCKRYRIVKERTETK